MIERQILTLSDKPKEAIIPTITTWKGSKMIRVHSFLSAMHEIVKYAEKLDYIKIGIIGDQHTGKTTLAKSMAHVIHRMAEKDLKIQFQVKVFTRDDLLNFRATLSNLNPANYILIFDDISFLHEASPKQLQEIKSAVTMIRHMEGGQDVKIIEIDDYHYTKGHDKYLRQSHFKIFTSIGSEETQNVISMTNPKYARKITSFQQMQAGQLSTGFFQFNIGIKGKPFVYKYRDPFIPVLFWNTSNLRYIVAPTREWIDRACSICAVAEGNKNTDFDLDKFKIAFDEKHGPGVAKQAVKLKMFSLGLNTYKTTLMRAMYELNKIMAEKNFNIMTLGQKYNLDISKPAFTKDFARLIQQTETKQEKLHLEEKTDKTVEDKHVGQIVEW